MRNGIEMALKSLFLPQNRKNYPAAGGSTSSVTRLRCSGLFSTGPKLTIFVQKTFTFGSSPLFLAKP